MNRLEKIKTLFDQASDLAPQDRASFLDAACADDSQLRAEVESLLTVDAEADGFLEQPLPLDLDAAPDGQSQIGRVIDRYRLLDEIGEGGMATVYLADRIDGQYHQRVAIKLVRPSVGAGEISRRFKQERQILARLDHPNIARLLDGGTTEEGWPYLAMEYIDGEPITKLCRRRGLSLNERLKLFQTVCAAVSYAHRNLVVHRDIKPSNILVTDTGVVKLLDFGIAKVLNPEFSEAAEQQTITGLRPMTPEYASPEQTLDQPITTASDVYSLGVLLYELLTGARPHDLKDRSIYEITRLICEEDPPPPSEKVMRLADSNFGAGENSRERLRRQLRGDLDNITLLALRKDPRQRYQSVEQLSADIGRYLAGETVSARPTTLLYYIGKRIRRNKTVVALAALVFILLFSFVGYLLDEGFKAARLAREQRHQIYALRLKEAYQAWREGDMARMDAALAECSPAPDAPAEEDLRGFEWRYLWRLAHSERLALTNARGDRLFDLYVHEGADGRRSYQLITSGEDNTVVNVWDLDTGWKLRSYSLPFNIHLRNGYTPKEFFLQENDHVVSVWGVVDGRRLQTFTDWTAKITATGLLTPDVFISGHADGMVKVWDRKTQRVVASFKNSDRPIIDLQNQEHALILAADQDRTLTVSNWVTGKTLVSIPSRQPTPESWFLTRDGRRLVILRANEDLKVLDVPTLRPVSTFRSAANSPLTIAEGADGDVITCDKDNLMRFWDRETGQLVAIFRGHNSFISEAHMSTDGKMMVTCSPDKTIRLWDIATQRQLAVINSSAQEIMQVQFSGDRNLLAASFRDRSVKIWDVAALLKPPPEVLTGHEHWIYSVAVSPDGDLAASACDDKTIKLWDTRQGTAATLTGHMNPVWTVAFSPDGRTLASGGHDGATILWDVETRRRVATFKHGDGYEFGVRSVAFAPDGRRLATAGNDGAVKLWDLASGQEIGSLLGHKGNVMSVAFSPDGRWIVTGGEDKTARLWDAATLREIRTFIGHQELVWSAKFSPDGRWLATGSRDNTARLWNPTTGETLREFKGHTDEVFCVAFTPDGRRLVTASNDYTIKFWDPTRDDVVFTLRDHKNEVWSVAFSKKGDLMASGSWDKTVRLWRAATEKGISPERK
jgi:WD40 repeat protein/tRNA A-37 threonylcarbamoyl transferase component Bud32